MTCSCVFSDKVELDVHKVVRKKQTKKNIRLHYTLFQIPSPCYNSQKFKLILTVAKNF